MGPMGKYQMFNRPHGMIGGMMNKPPEMANVPPNWLIYFRVPDVDAAAERIKANGGKILERADGGSGRRSGRERDRSAGRRIRASREEGYITATGPRHRTRSADILVAAARDVFADVS